MADAHAAARDGDLEALNSYIAAGSNLNQRDKHSRTPLHLAAWAGKAECVEALLKAGCDLKAVAQDETSALHFASQTGRTDVCRILLNAGVPRHAETVELLLKRKATPSATNRNDQTPLSLATDDAVRALLQAAAAAALDPGPAPEHGAIPVQPNAEAGEAAAAPGDAGSKPKRERHRGRKRRGADGDFGGADGFQPWRAPQFDQLAAAEAAAAAAEHGGEVDPDPKASAAEAPSIGPVGPSEERSAVPGAHDCSVNPAGSQPAGVAPADAGAQRADAGGAAPATGAPNPAQDAPVFDKTPQEGPSIGPAERPAPAANGAGPGAEFAAGLGSVTVRKRPRVALAHLGDEEEGGEEE